MRRFLLASAPPPWKSLQFGQREVSSERASLFWKASWRGGVSDVLYYFGGGLLSAPIDEYDSEDSAYIQTLESRLPARIARRWIALIYSLSYHKRKAVIFRVITDEVFIPSQPIGCGSQAAQLQHNHRDSVSCCWKFYKGAFTMHPLTPRLSLLAAATAIVSSLVNSHVPEPYLVCLLVNSFSILAT